MIGSTRDAVLTQGQFGARLRRVLVHDRRTSMISVATVVCLGVLLWMFARWAVIDATWSGPVARCADQVRGACWAAVIERHRFLLFGYYPYAEQWRPALAVLIVVGMLAISAIRMFWRPALIVAWGGALAVAYILMTGGVGTLRQVTSEQWGGLPLVFILFIFGWLLAMPLGTLLALAKNSPSAVAMRSFATMYVEIFRGVPLVTVLFISSILVPLFLPDTMQISKLLRAQLAVGLFTAAQVCEVVRGGLIGVPAGQSEAARALSLGTVQRVGLVILPQALRLALPGLVNVTIGLFKSTSLVAIIGLFDLTLNGKTVLADPAMEPHFVEIYLFIGAIFATACFSISRYGRRLERKLNARG